ncbi:MAG: hypothetical protein HY296_06160 [Thaumarchaeota archaeon]|nr:hypothetical protein [Nitrososphaerota archaeon]
MGVDEKVAEAEYFLQRLRTTYPNDDFKFELSAFLSSVRSIADYLLEEYNQKCKLGITITDKLTIPTFKAEATRSGNSHASKFIRWYEAEIGRIGNNPIGRLVFTRRNLNIHRAQGPLHAKITLHEYLTITESVTVTVYDEKGQVIGVGGSQPSPPPTSKPAESEISWYFSDYTSEDIPTVCEKSLGMIRKLVEDARKSFS